MTNIRPAPNNQENRSQTTRRRLCTAATEVLIDDGMKGFSFVRVCQKAGLSRGAIHHHYVSIPDLLADVIADLYAKLFAAVVADLPSVTLHGSDLSEPIDRLWQHFRSPYFRVLLEIRAAMISDHTLAKALAGPGSGTNQAMIDGALAHYRGRLDEPTLRVVLAALTGLALQYFTLERQQPAQAEEYAAGFIKSLKTFVAQRQPEPSNA